MQAERDEMLEDDGNATTPDDFEELVPEISLSCPPKKQRKFTDLKPQSCISKPFGEFSSTSPSNGKRESLSRLKRKLAVTEEHTDDSWGTEYQHLNKNNCKHRECDICTLDGELLFCIGKECRRSYHISCLDPPLKDTPPGVWHCMRCVRKKMKMGVYSVSEGMESIWDVREVLSDHEEKERHKEYLVKYRGLAHVHSRWIPETKLLLEAPKLVANFKRQIINWKKEWTVPQRLLHKRWLSFDKHPDDDYCGNLDCHYEWLVKWSGLGYEHATWELENALFLRSSQALKLIQDYESRHDKAERPPRLSEAEKEREANFSGLCAYQSRKANFSMLSELTSGDSSEAYIHYLDYVNKLREYWHKGQNAIVFDNHIDQERIVKVVLFILSLQQIVWRPFLIITSANALSVWENEFLHVASSVNFIVYKGNKDVRHSIRSFEFSNEGGKIMFQVLLTSSNIVLEDLEELKSIAWRAMIIDECQRPIISRNFKEFLALSAEMKLLLSSQVKDCSVFCNNMLFLLDSGVNDLNSAQNSHSSADITKAKERLAPYIAYECISGCISDSFVEYWVPVRLSNVQLEKYCSLLLSNKMLLQSCLKNDPADVLHNIVTSIRKCCDHPYLLESSLRDRIRKDLPAEKHLDVDIQVSGKLLLLDKMLKEIKNRGLRVIIIFQSIGGLRSISVGDILEEFVCQRFGKDSYVRIDGGKVYTHKKKKVALNMFNSKYCGRFVCLIENRACLPSIKLSSVDTIILFDSDLDPLNDLKFLNKISITLQFENFKVLRLYSRCTIEEMVLILAKESTRVENVYSKNRSMCHSHLSWGVSHLFAELDEFHKLNKSASGSDIYSEWSFLNDVLSELSDQWQYNRKTDPSHYSFISKAHQIEGAYARDISLAGEKESCSVNTKSPSHFWKNLLDGRDPKWQFLTGLPLRIRRKVSYLNNFHEESETEKSSFIKESQDVKKKRGNPVLRKPRPKLKRKLIAADEKQKASANCSSFWVIDSSTMHSEVDDIGRVSEVNMVESDKHDILPGQSSLQLEITWLCDILKLPENVKAISMAFHDYIMEKYDVSWGTTDTMQAFGISLCWAAASLLKYKINHMESLGVAKQYLNFDCEEREANYIYSRLWSMKRKFGYRLENLTTAEELNHVKNSNSITSDQQCQGEEELKRGHQSQFLSDQLVELEAGEIPSSPSAANCSKSTSDQNDLTEEGTPCKQTVADNLMESKEDALVHSNHAYYSCEQDSQKEPDGKISVNSQKSGMLDNLMDMEEGEKPAQISDVFLNIEEVGGLLVGRVIVIESDEERDDVETNVIESSVEKSVAPTCNVQKMEVTSYSHQLDDGAPRPISSDQQDQDEEELKQGHQNQFLSGQLVELEEGEIPPSPSAANCSKSSSDQNDLTEAETRERTIGDNLLDLREDAQGAPDGKYSMNSQKGSMLDDLMDIKEGEKLTQRSDVFLNIGKVDSLPLGTVTVIESDEGRDDVEINVLESAVQKNAAPFCNVRKSEVNSYSHQLEDGAARPISVEKLSPDEKEQIIEVVMGNQPQKLSNTPQSPCDGGVMVGQPAELSSSNVQNSEDPQCLLHEKVLVETPSESSTHAIRACITQNRQANSCSPGPLGLEDGLPGSTCTEKQSTCQNKHVLDLVTETSEGPQTPVHEVVMDDQPAETSVQELPVAMEIIDLSETSQDNEEANPAVVPPDVSSVERISIPVYQPPISSVSDDSPLHANHVMLGRIQHASSDPFQIEMERILKNQEEDFKKHQDAILCIKAERDRELEEVHKKYDMLLQDAERALLHKKTDRTTKIQKLYANKLLALTLILKEALTPDIKQAAQSNPISWLVQQLVQNPTQPSMSRPEPVAVASSVMLSNQAPAAPATTVVRPSSGPITDGFIPQSNPISWLVQQLVQNPTQPSMPRPEPVAVASSVVVSNQAQAAPATTVVRPSSGPITDGSIQQFQNRQQLVCNPTQPSMPRPKPVAVASSVVVSNQPPAVPATTDVRPSSGPIADGFIRQSQNGYGFRAPAPHLRSSISTLQHPVLNHVLPYKQSRRSSGNPEQANSGFPWVVNQGI